MLFPLVFIALSQVPDPDSEDRVKKAEKAVNDLLERARKAPGDIVVEPPKGDPPHLAFDRETFCTQLTPTKTVPSGNFRVQCYGETKQCLAAPNKVLHDGVESEEELQRTGLCSAMPAQELKRFADDGFTFVEAVAEAPDGWYRDDLGRIVQVNFDLHRRVYFGGAWSPLYKPGPYSNLSDQQLLLGRGRADFGIEVEIPNDNGRELHRLHFLDGSAWLGADTRVMATGVRYDFSLRRVAPPMWLTTFVGKPHRIDLDVNISGWFEALRLELVNDQSFLTLASANAAFDLWHSKDLQSYLRVRVGPAAELDLQTKSVALRPEAALEGDFTLDRDGFHHITFAATGEKLFFDPHVDGRHDNPERFRAKAGYEVILLAVNDYPLTLVLDGFAGWRDDLTNVVPGWEFGADLGLRFSFWAPQRRTATQVFHRG
jgi:hypothetical protein